MTLPEPVTQAAKWALLVGLAYYGADLSSALIARQLQVAPKPLPQASVGPIQESVPAQAAPPSLVTMLRATGNGEEPTESTTVAASGANPSIKKPANQPPANIQLRGTMAGPGGSGLAMIDVNGQTRVVSTGEEVGGYTLTAVSTFSVTLEANGQVQTLEMNSDGPTQASPPPVAAAPVQQDPNMMPTPEATPDPNSPEANATPGEAGAILTQRELRNILDNPAQFAGKGFRMKPVLNGGEIIGMRVSMTDGSHPLARLGIQDGDVVKSLNGTPLNGPEALSSIYRVLRNTSSLKFEVDRGGSSQDIDITLEE